MIFPVEEVIRDRESVYFLNFSAEHTSADFSAEHGILFYVLSTSINFILFYTWHLKSKQRVQTELVLIGGPTSPRVIQFKARIPGRLRLTSRQHGFGNKCLGETLNWINYTMVLHNICRIIVVYDYYQLDNISISYMIYHIS